MFRVTQPYLNLLVKPRFFFMFSGKNICVPTLHKIFRPVTRNTHIFFLFGLISRQQNMSVAVSESMDTLANSEGKNEIEKPYNVAFH